MRVRLLFAGLILMFTGCDTNTQHHTTQAQKKEAAYVDFQRWTQGRVCDKLLWKCLPESNDTKRWQRPLENGLDSLELTPQVMRKFKASIKAWNAYYHNYMKTHPNATREDIMLITSLDKDFFEKVEAKQFLKEMEQDLEKEFPGFWRDTPKKVRYRWIQRAMNKAKRFGITSKAPGDMVELCARIGLDFDRDPKWDYIVKFIEEDPKNHVVYAVDYIDWTVFNKEYNNAGTKITDWSMGRAIGKLPDPKKPYPRLND